VKRRRAPRSYTWPRRRVNVELRVMVNGMYFIGQGFIALPAELRARDIYSVRADTPYTREFLGPDCADLRVELRVLPTEAV
jgi:hypothetical protein